MGDMVSISSEYEEFIELSENELNDKGEFHYLSTAGLSGPYKSPYKKGDIIYVRETWQKVMDPDTQEISVRYAADNPDPIYECDGDGFQVFNKDGSEKIIGWRPSIHMPKEAARIWLEVTDVRVERVKDIKEEQARLEGVQILGDRWMKENFVEYHVEWVKWSLSDLGIEHAPAPPTMRDRFEKLWVSIYGQPSWDNDYVFVNSFKILSTIGKP